MTPTIAESLNLDALADYLTRVGVPLGGPLRAEFLTGGRSNLTFRVSDGTSSWVLRRPPLHGATPSAHDMRREYRVASALSPKGFPVACPVALCEDREVLGAPFTLVDYVSGRVIRTEADLVGITSDDVVRDCVFGLIDVLADLHRINPVSIGLGEWGHPDGYLSRQVNRWITQWDLVRNEDDPCDDDLRRLHGRLAESIPPQSATSIVHGDYRIDNTILDPDEPHRVRAVVDWELSTLGDPLADAALMCVYRDPAFDLVIGARAAWTSPRLPTVDELAQRYSTSTGLPLRYWDFHLALGYFKVAVIAAGIDYRRRSNDGIRDRAGDAVAPLIAAGLRRLKGATG
jgi:aminoglycoside phosphotransferase (APT) family kinase protein